MSLIKTILLIILLFISNTLKTTQSSVDIEYHTLYQLDLPTVEVRHKVTFYENFYLLARLINCEAGNQPLKGMIAVGNVVLNRVRNRYHLNDTDRIPNKALRDVITAKNQFNGVETHWFNKKPSERAILAAKIALKENIIPTTVEFFHNKKIATGKGWIRHIEKYKYEKIGEHTFCHNKNLMEKYYKQWRSNNGEFEYVEKIEFIDYVKDRSTIIRFDDYIGEEWMCRNTRGEQIRCKFRVKDVGQADGGERIEVGWEYNKSPIRDISINYHIHPYEIVEKFVYSSDYISINFDNDLITQKDKEDRIKVRNLAFLLKNIDKKSNLAKAIRIKMSFISSPTLHVSKMWKEVDPILKKQITAIVNEKIVL